MRAMFVLGGAAAAVALLALFVSRSTVGPDIAPVTEREALAALEQTAALVAMGSFDTLCEHAGAHQRDCRMWLDEADWREAPLAPPTVRNSEQLGAVGWLLTVCGRTASGKPYVAGFAVYRREGADVEVPYPVYWSGLNVAGAGGVLPGVPASAASFDCPGHS